MPFSEELNGIFFAFLMGNVTKKIAKANLALAKTGRTQNAASLPSVRDMQRTRHHNLLYLSFRYGSSSRT